MRVVYINESAINADDVATVTVFKDPSWSCMNNLSEPEPKIVGATLHFKFGAKSLSLYGNFTEIRDVIFPKG